MIKPLYRALPARDIAMVKNMQADLLSESMSRVMATSGLNEKPYFICLTESPKIAIKYSKKPGYSGKIGMIMVDIDATSGNLKVLDQPGDVWIHRTWELTDWLDLARLSQWPDTATNVNYGCSPKPIENIITYGARTSPRAFAHSDRSWILHSSEPVVYRLLSEDEIRFYSELKRYNLWSHKFIKYNFSDPLSTASILNLITIFQNKDNSKAYNRIMVSQLKELLI